MVIKFKALSDGNPAEGDNPAEQELFQAELASEQAGRGQPMNEVAATGGEAGNPTSSAEPEAGASGAAEGTVAEPASSAPEKKPDEDESAKTFEALLELSAGKREAHEVDLGEDGVAQRPIFAHIDNPEMDDLADVVKESVVKDADARDKGLLTPEPAAAGMPASAATGSTAGQPVAAVAAAPAGGQFASTVGGVVGRVAADVVATPFIAVSSAARHLSQRIGKAMSPLPPSPGSVGRSLSASLAGASPAIFSSLEAITEWKCDRIERAAAEVVKRASALSETEEFAVWEDALQTTASHANRGAEELVSRLHEDPDLNELKDTMTSLWQAHPDRVAAYRKASEDFVRNIDSVVKEFPNTEDGIKERVAKAMETVTSKTNLLPGFGANMGEYQRTIAERVREMVEMIQAFARKLAAALSGRSPSNQELTM